MSGKRRQEAEDALIVRAEKVKVGRLASPGWIAAHPPKFPAFDLSRRHEGSPAEDEDDREESKECD